jgi:hypothetical protein
MFALKKTCWPAGGKRNVTGLGGATRQQCSIVFLPPSRPPPPPPQERVDWRMAPLLAIWDNPPQIQHPFTEAEFFDVIGTKVFRVFLLAIHSHLY